MLLRILCTSRPAQDTPSLQKPPNTQAKKLSSYFHKCHRCWLRTTNTVCSAFHCYSHNQPLCQQTSTHLSVFADWFYQLRLFCERKQAFLLQNENSRNHCIQHLRRYHHFTKHVLYLLHRTMLWGQIFDTCFNYLFVCLLLWVFGGGFFYSLPFRICCGRGLVCPNLVVYCVGGRWHDCLLFNLLQAFWTEWELPGSNKLARAGVYYSTVVMLAKFGGWQLWCYCCDNHTDFACRDLTEVVDEWHCVNGMCDIVATVMAWHEQIA